MNEQLNRSKKFLKYFAITALLLLLAIGGLSYVIDPFFQFRIRDNSYLLNPRLVNPGLAKNYDYNIAIIGSSMVQNFNLSLLRADGKTKPLKLASGAMTVEETMLLFSLVKKEEVNSVVINIDATQFNLLGDENRYPSYLCKDTPLNTLEYLYGYETCVRYLPVDIGMQIYSIFKPLPTYLSEKMNVDDLGNFVSISEYGKQVVIDKYKNGITVAFQNPEGMDQRMAKRLDEFLARIDLDANKHIQFTFMLPPYSALYWHLTKEREYYDHVKKFAKLLTEKLGKYPNVKIVSFYQLDEITNLDNYSDVTHFTPQLSDKIVNNLNNPDFYLTSSNIDERLSKLDSLVADFEQTNKDWFIK